MKKIATDTYSFAELREKDLLYVDKTAYIWQMIDSGSKSFFLSRPRRFGKSLTVSTLECFFKNRRELFRGLDIDRLAPEDIWEEWPVIRLDMAQASSPMGVSQTIERMTNLLQEAGQGMSIDIVMSEPVVMLHNLIHSLYIKYDKQVVVLIDEYDKPLLDALNKPYVNEVLEYMASFYQELKSSGDKLRFIFLTGVSKFAHTSLFSGFNNPNDISRSAKYATMLGYTQEELETVFTEFIEETRQKFNFSREELLARLKANYNGFRFTDNCASVYNPVSIGKFFTEQKFLNFWWETGTPRVLVEMMRTHPFALEEKTSRWFPADSFGKSEIESINAFDLAIQAGYLTIAESKTEDTETFIRYDFPNKEIRDSWYTCMLGIAAKAQGVEDVRFELVELRQMLDEADVEGFMTRLCWFFAGMPYENVSLREGNFRNHLRTIFVLFGLPNQSEVQVARGRIDIVAQTRKCAFVFEIKMAESSNEASTKLEEALKQAAEKHYADKYMAESAQVKVIAIVFDSSTRRIAAWKELIEN